MSVASQTPSRTGHAMPTSPVQRLPREAYVSPEWFERERRNLFGRTWTWACLAGDLPEPGHYTTVAAGDHPLVVLRDDAGALRAFHNLCRHRGTELVEGTGRLDAARIMCPYHRWTYDLDGTLQAVPLRAKCFPSLDTADYSLLPAALGEFKGMVFVHPDPGADFSEWRADLESVAWPHRFERMRAGPEVTYEMRCNWKVFFENAIDGYHLAYLHNQTLGGPRADRNVWDVHGRHLVWYSTETGRKTCMPLAVAKAMGHQSGKATDAVRSGEYGGVFMLFPSTIVTAYPSGLSVSRLEGVTAGVSRLSTRMWQHDEAGWKWLRGEERPEDFPGYDPESGVLRLSHLKQHPLETGDFQWEDVWVCEKMQRSLNSPAYRIAQLAAGAGAEAPLEFFQRNVLDFITERDSQPGAACAEPHNLAG